MSVFFNAIEGYMIAELVWKYRFNTGSLHIDGPDVSAPSKTKLLRGICLLIGQVAKRDHRYAPRDREVHS